jgi:hypothetical protein
MNMRIFLLFLTLTSLMIAASSCGNNPKPEVKEETVNPVDTSSISEPTQDTSADEPSKESSNQGNANKNKAPDGPAPDYSSIPGPVGFVSEDNLVMRDKPDSKSGKIATLKKNETIYILETSMVGEDGKQTEYPTWYRIERKSKERGWVKASEISSGH